MSKFTTTVLALTLMSGPAWADGHASGDAEAGEKVYSKCKACHMIKDDAGEDVVRGGRTGPNLWGIYDRVAGSEEEYEGKYGDSLVAAGEAGLQWAEEDFVAYVQDPRGFLKTYLDDSKARSKMSFKLRKEEEARNVWAYLVSVGPEVEMKEDGDAEMTDNSEEESESTD